MSPRVDRDFPPAVKADVCERADFRCEICRERPISCYHHRLRRSAGGLGTLDNCLGLCDGRFGTPGCHEFVHANPKLSYELGYLLHAGAVAS
jgi:hypothetical protein